MTLGVESETGTVRPRRIVARTMKSDEHMIARRKAIVVFQRPLGGWRYCDSELSNELVSLSFSSPPLTGLYFSRDPGLGIPKNDFGNENAGILLNEGAQ